MTQANDLGAIANQQGAFYRAAVNNNIQAAVTQHYGAVEPQVLYPNMIWFSSGDGYIKVRSPTNTSWQNIGTIGPPLRWTNIDLPAEGFITGDIKASYNQTQLTGWLLMNDGTIGNQNSGAQSRSNPDCWSLFNLIWSVASDDWCPIYSASTTVRAGRGTTALADWNNNRHLALPKMLGRVPGASGWGSGLSNLSIATWQGTENVVLSQSHIPSHSHSITITIPSHIHPLSSPLPSYVGGKGSASGGFTLADQSTGVSWTDGSDPINASGNTSTFGAGAAHPNVQPTTYLYYFIKL